MKSFKNNEGIQLSLIGVHSVLINEKRGGKQKPIFEGYRPNLVFGFNNKRIESLYDGKIYSFEEKKYKLDILTKNVDSIFLFNKKETYIAGSEFICHIGINENRVDYIKNFLYKGSDFLIREGGYWIVGYGKIISL